MVLPGNMYGVAKDTSLENPLYDSPRCATSILARLFEDARAEEPVDVLEETDASSVTPEIDAETEVE